MAATIARLARMANVFTAYVNLNVELESSRAGEFGLTRSGLYSQPLFYSPVLPAVFVFTLAAQSSLPSSPIHTFCNNQTQFTRFNMLHSGLPCFVLPSPLSSLPTCCFHLRCPPFSCVCVHFLYGIFTLRSTKKREGRK